MYFNKRTLTALGFASLAAADSDAFGMLLIRSAAPYQNSGVYPKDGIFAISTSTGSVTVTDDGLLVSADGKYASVDASTFAVTAVDEADATGCWAIEKGYLVYNGKGAFSIAESNEQLYATSGDEYTYSISAFGASGKVPDFAPANCKAGASSGSGSGSSAGNSTNATTPATSSASGTTVAAGAKTSAVASASGAASSAASSSSAVVQTANGAAKSGIAVGALAAAAALLF